MVLLLIGGGTRNDYWSLIDQMVLVSNAEKEALGKLDLTDLGLDCASWGEFVLGIHHGQLILVLLNYAISCDGFETKFLPKINERKIIPL